MTDQGNTQRIDGRRARGERTRLNVLEALLALVEEGQLRPTAQEVAERAGVALRTVYHHFEDVEALRRLAFDLQVGRNREALRPLDASLDCRERCRIVAHQLRRYHEAISPIRRAVLLEERSSPAMADVLRRSRQLRRQFIEQAFGPEVEPLDVAARRALFDALDVTTSWQSWYYLRASLGRGAQLGERVLAFQLEQLVGRGGGVESAMSELVGEGEAAEGGAPRSGGERAAGESRLDGGAEEEPSGRTLTAARDRRRRNPSSRSRPAR